jgi:transposase InsO family protein
MVTPAAKREAVAHLGKVHEMSERRACRVVGCDRMTVRYRSRRPDDPKLRERLRALARERRRFGYRRLLIFLRREGFVVNHKRLLRIYREERLMVRKRGGRKRALGTRAPMAIPAAPNDLWSLDFVSDQFDLRPPVPDSGGLRCLHPRMPCHRRRHLAVGQDEWHASSIFSSPGEAGPRRSSATTAQS